MARSLVAVLILLLAVLEASTAARAHSFLDRADPRVGGTVRASPAQVRLWFTGALEPAYSRVRVLDEAGRQVDGGDSQVDAQNAALLRVSLPPLPPGRYKVTWRVLSVDSHVVEGDFTFRVAP